MMSKSETSNYKNSRSVSRTKTGQLCLAGDRSLLLQALVVRILIPATEGECSAH